MCLGKFLPEQDLNIPNEKTAKEIRAPDGTIKVCDTNNHLLLNENPSIKECICPGSPQLCEEYVDQTGMPSCVGENGKVKHAQRDENYTQKKYSDNTNIIAKLTCLNKNNLNRGEGFDYYNDPQEDINLHV